MLIIQPSHDGYGRDDLHSQQAKMQPVPSRIVLPCQAASNPQEYPGKKPKTDKPVKATWFVMLYHDNAVWLEQRPQSGIWGGLYCFPQSEIANIQTTIDQRAIGDSTITSQKTPDRISPHL